MGAIGSAIGNAVKAGMGDNSTTLQDFLDFFSQSDGRWANQIDPYNTFEVNIKFYPLYPKPSSDDEDFWSKAGSSLWGSFKSGITNLANNMTGGLVGAFTNEIDVLKKREEFKDVALYKTFLEYLVPASLIKCNSNEGCAGSKTGEAATVSPLEINLGMYCQEVTVPNMRIDGMSDAETQVGKVPVNGTMVMPDNNNLNLTILNTKLPLIERIFYPWMREVTNSFWTYDSQPYTTATITVDYTKHSNVKYVFTGCRPIFIGTQQGRQQNGDVTRLVTLAFDFMFITSNLKNQESALEKVLGTVGGLAGGTANMIGL